MEFKRFSIDVIACGNVLRSLGTGPQSVKLVKALWNSTFFGIFEVMSSLAFIILKGYLTRNLKVHPKACGGSFLVL